MYQRRTYCSHASPSAPPQTSRSASALQIGSPVSISNGYEGEYVIADKGYDSNEFVQLVMESGMIAVIPPRSNRKNPRPYDERLYRECNLVERFISKLKHYRRAFSRFDKLDSRYLGFLHFIAFSSGCDEMSTLPRSNALIEITD